VPIWGLAIVDADIWDAVQQRLATHRRRRTLVRVSDESSPLAGRLFDPDGRKMRPSHASKNGRRYRYVSAALIDTGVAQGARLAHPGEGTRNRGCSRGRREAARPGVPVAVDRLCAARCKCRR
jgi:hypothetical protein